MGFKKIVTLFILTLVMVILVACGTEEEKSMYIKPVEFTEDEIELIKLTGGNDKGLIEYSIDESISAITIKAVEYTKGEEPKVIGKMSSSILQEDKRNGMIYVNIDQKTWEFTYGVNGGRATGTIERTNDISQRVTGYLSNEIEIIPDTEMPVLVIKEQDNRASMSSYIMEYYMESPEKIASNDYDNTIAVYLIFNTTPISY